MVDAGLFWGEWAERGTVPTFCLNVVRGLAADEVVAAYGADPGRLRQLSLAEADSRYPMAKGGALLRVGRLGEWTFCFEAREAEGFKPGVLARLSERSEVVSLFYADGMTVVERLEEGRLVERFEPGQRSPVQGSEPHTLQEGVRAELRNSTAPSTTEAALRVIARHIGAEIPWATLAGPLATVVLGEAEREPLAPHFAAPAADGPAPGLGRSLGGLDLPIGPLP
ncbi:DUF6461 domain-containing protein [Kitasatospora purpeofusca]|uniref:DUF6461 domain-containing protein n=1 Tax=Kitasatospora purpeofusca TaxID=67352 RepID=UPI00386BBB42|nr:DUF6461 domain-containing protein [Kitasatospora purpeofusca]